MPLTSRAIAVALVGVIAVASLAGCKQEKEDRAPEEQPKSKLAAVMRANPVCALDVKCGEAEKLWRGPDKSTVHVAITGGTNCPVSLALFDRKTEKDTKTVLTANPGQTVQGAVSVPNTSLLRCICTGEQAKSVCKCSVTGVDPPLPPNVALGLATTIAASPAVTDPAAGASLAAGTALKLSCGKMFTLWSGPESYVTATLKGSENCLAKLIPERAGHGVGGGEEITDNRSWSRTFGPITKLTASCEGAAAKQLCEFEVTETIKLP